VQHSDRGPAPPVPSAIAGIVQLSLWAALVAGLGELALRLVARRVLPEPVFLDPSSVWLGPVSGLLVITPLVALAWLLGRMRGKQAAWMMSVAMATFLMAFDVVLLVPRLHLAGLAVLAAGLAAQAVLIARRWPRPFARLVHWSTAVLLAVAVGGAVLVGRNGGSGRLSMVAKAREGAPNVLLLVLDTVRALELSAYGYARATSPRLAALASEGVRFDRAVASAPWTLPSHATLFTGLFQRDLSVGWRTPLDSVPPTLAEHFRSRGYATGGFVANMRFTTREYGLARGFEMYRDYALIGSQVVGSTMLGRRAIGAWNDLTGGYVVLGRKDAHTVVGEFLDWQGQEDERPFFAFLNVFDAHEPYAPDAPYDLQFALREPPTRRLEVGRRHSQEELQGLRDAYDGAIASLDAQLGRMLDELQRRGVLENTIVVVTSDHGEEFGEHGHVSHGNGLHFPALHIPLLVWWPRGGVPAGRVVAEAVSLADVPATIVALAGNGGEPSLAPLWRGEPMPNASPILSELYWVRNQPDWYPVAAGNMRSLVRGRFHLIDGQGDQDALYDIMGDPYEGQNLIGDRQYADTLAALRAALTAFSMRDRAGR
jgi:arylsulfatase A-like enzyme